MDDRCRETLTPPKTSHVSSFSSEDRALVQLSRLTGYTIGLSALGAASQAVSTPEIRWTEPRRASVRLPWPGCIFLSDSQWRTGPDAPPTPPHSCPGPQDVPVVRSSPLLIFFFCSWTFGDFAVFLRKRVLRVSEVGVCYQLCEIFQPPPLLKCLGIKVSNSFPVVLQGSEIPQLRDVPNPSVCYELQSKEL